ncbi:hypothetical protein AB835_12430 [Candidatus Endobugula sertula]|uniref:Molybdopterin oxidoreductase domain-containing protein n=1 Tax=Candidatus Endobugula sertula TaxID=62101 RepID=A0A1D2QMD1_9GAMM|nr:hypothetical protein AB835_12430 [Candidatus Endobugula sertula]
MAMGHVVLKEFHLADSDNSPSEYFDDYSRMYTDMPFLVMLEEKDGAYVPSRTLRASDLTPLAGEENAEWKPVLLDENTDEIAIPSGTIGSRWDKSGRWNLELKNVVSGEEIWPCKSLVQKHDDVLSVAFPYFGNQENEQEIFQHTDHNSILNRHVPVRKVSTKDGDVYVATVFDLMMANYGVDQGLGGDNVATSFDDDIPYTPAWQEKITGVSRDKVITVAREFADKTRGKSMVILGAAVNHWYHMDMIYRGIINLLMMCGCIGKSGGGWSHYVGQEKLRPQTGWQPLAFGLDWHRPPRHMNSTSFFYNHSNQWRYEKLDVKEILSPLADQEKWEKYSLIDCNVRSERMGWLPSAPQLQENPLELSKQAKQAGQSSAEYVVDRLKNDSLHFSCEDPDEPRNFPRNLFIWRSNILGSSGKGHEYTCSE